MVESRVCKKERTNQDTAYELQIEHIQVPARTRLTASVTAHQIFSHLFEPIVGISDKRRPEPTLMSLLAFGKFVSLCFVSPHTNLCLVHVVCKGVMLFMHVRTHMYVCMYVLQ